MYDMTKKATINGIPYTIHITKWTNKEWKLTVLEARNIPNVFNHSPEKCMAALEMQLKGKGSNLVWE